MRPHVRPEGTIYPPALLASIHGQAGSAEVQEYETSSAREAQRCKQAQYTGRITTVVLAGQTVTGMVRSVFEDKISSPKRWIVAIDLTSVPPTFPFRKIGGKK